MTPYRIWAAERERGRTERPVAAALGYDPEQDVAPRVLAIGEGKVAEQILALAQEYEIPVVEDKALAAALATLDIGAMIPVELYAVVAEILVYVYRLRGHLPEALKSRD
ncbi:hypothetical protein SE15_02805 [Thermanaerothrix daxensis]|uniref:Flagellar biosynthesis protein FlhB n=1 Tax=Thermanaerothrix daxensis TaxID=869279 RepID=A0A0N8GQM6_9CHLR|nr:EscU/YscU/HrcU family type III secretion system export apparatus switch protein [Thermanaerothrix daxensis]KPL84122.1 hypothetical protein SE15_02805 [Thermanaerothrix daxensis]